MKDYKIVPTISKYMRYNISLSWYFYYYINIGDNLYHDSEH